MIIEPNKQHIAKTKVNQVDNRIEDTEQLESWKEQTCGFVLTIFVFPILWFTLASYDGYFVLYVKQVVLE